MKLGGLQKTTLIDYPGKVACTVFLAGCNFRCPFCYNPELVLEKTASTLSEKDFFDFLKERAGQLDGVVVCGGEPTIHEDLPDFCRKTKELGFAVKLDTNGSNPEMLKQLIENKLIDCVALDVKAPKERYSGVVGVNADVERVELSVAILKMQDIDYEFRTTVVPTLLDKKDVIKIAEWIGPAKTYFLQNFQPKKTVDPRFEDVEPYPKEYIEEIRKRVAHMFEICEIR